ncbi:MAG: MBL fold metallo-hydrolase [Leptolyngbya sp. RL_3_1]|nr:MBL fold metallo-hydrolase [Leptolyngbya sp. RL_3_1]
MQVTWLDSNSWLWELADQRVLVDPWLVGPLTFGNAAWLFRGEHPQPRAIPEGISLILLSQGLPDHAHPPTLKALDKSIPVIGSPSAAQVATDLGFTQVTALDHGESHHHGGVTIQAVPGAPVGPTTLENGYVLTDQSSGLNLFYEPHGFHQDTLKALAPVDVVITPMLDLSLPLVGPIIRGGKSAQELANWLQPQVMLPTANAGEAEYHGLLVSLLKAQGGVEAVRAALAASGQTAQVMDPQVGDRLQLPLTPRTAALS